jgi:hypothetical protein
MESKDSVPDWVQKGLSLPNEAHETFLQVVQALFPSLHDNQLILATGFAEIAVVGAVLGAVTSLIKPMTMLSWSGFICVVLTLDDKDWYPPFAVGFLALCSFFLAGIAELIYHALKSIEIKLSSIDNKLYEIDNKLYAIDSAIEQAKLDIDLRELNKD